MFLVINTKSKEESETKDHDIKFKTSGNTGFDIWINLNSVI